MVVYPLGTNGFFPSFGRQTACYAIPFENTLIIIDAGSGLFRFAEPIGQKLLKDTTSIHIFLSHYHLDHTFGFYAAFRLFKGKPVTVFSKSGKRVFEDLTKQKYFSIDYNSFFNNFKFRTLEQGKNKIGNYQVNVRNQHHGGATSLSFRFDDFGLAYVTDSEPSLESVQFIKNSKLLLHEHWQSGENISINNPLEKHFLQNHVTTVGAALTAKLANVNQLALIHHYPFHTDNQLKSQEKIARFIFSLTTIARDLYPITITRNKTL